MLDPTPCGWSWEILKSLMCSDGECFTEPWTSRSESDESLRAPSCFSPSQQHQWWALTIVLRKSCGTINPAISFVNWPKTQWCFSLSLMLDKAHCVIGPIRLCASMVARLSFSCCTCPVWPGMSGAGGAAACTLTLGQVKRPPSSHPSSVALTPPSPPPQSICLSPMGKLINFALD